MGNAIVTGKIVIVDDHPLFRDALRRIIQRVIAGQTIEASDARELHEKLEGSSPPLAMFLDLVFPGFNGATSIKELRQKYPHSAIIVVSMTDDPLLIQQTMDAGANGYISKSVAPSTMLQSIGKILEGETLVCVEGPKEIPEVDPSLLDGLTQRHLEVLVRIGQGQTNKEIARELMISPFTVRAHVSALFKILGVNTRSAASTLATERGLI